MTSLRSELDPIGLIQTVLAGLLSQSWPACIGIEVTFGVPIRGAGYAVHDQLAARVSLSSRLQMEALVVVC